jgi:hypothetical protein
MPHRICRLFTAFLFMLLIGGFPPTHAASSSDQSIHAPQQSAKPMKKKEPMAGEMKKDGMMKEDVSKAAAKWDKKMELSKSKDSK